jgi:hypothetical protein
MLMAKNARWYQETTERIRVWISCSIKVAAVIEKRPM